MSRRRLRRRNLGRLLLIGGACLLALLYYRPIRAYTDVRHTLAERTTEVKALEAQNRSLQTRVTANAAGADIVQIARRLGYVRPGEHLYIVKGIKAWARAHPQTQSTK